MNSLKIQLIQYYSKLVTGMQHVFLRFQSNETQGAVVFCGQDKTNRRDRLPLIPMILCDLEVPRAGAPSPLWCLSLDYEQSPFFLRDSRATETRARQKITPHEFSPRRVSPFLAWGDFHARSRFACSTIPEENWGLLVVTPGLAFFAGYYK